MSVVKLIELLLRGLPFRTVGGLNRLHLSYKSLGRGLRLRDARLGSRPE